MENKKTVDAFYALGQKARLEILRLLVTSGSEGLAAGVVGQRLRLPLATLSFHLTQLVHAGLITARRQGRSIVYAANFKTVHDLIQFLIDNCCEVPRTTNLPVHNKKPRLKLRLKSE